jgi:hypothetical protein
VEDEISDQKFKNQDSNPFYGYSIIDQDDWANHRLVSKTFQLMKKKVSIEAGTW